MFLFEILNCLLRFVVLVLKKRENIHHEVKLYGLCNFINKQTEIRGKKVSNVIILIIKFTVIYVFILVLEMSNLLT